MDDIIRNPAPATPEPARTETPRPNLPVQPFGPKAKKHLLRKTLIVLLVLLLIAGSGAGAYMYRDNKAKNAQKNDKNQITQLESQISDLKKQLETEKAKATDAATKTAATKVAPTAAQLENIKASVTSKNTAALEGYMASTIHVIIAASEGIGDRTPVQAVKDVDYVVKGGTAPWNFALPAATLAKYRAGDYKQYFPADALIGKSANNYVISFTFNDAGKISGIFMTNNDSVL